MTLDFQEEIEGYQVHYDVYNDELGRTQPVYREFNSLKNAKDFYYGLFVSDEYVKPFKLVIVYRHYEIQEESKI